MPGGSVNLTCVAVGAPMPYVKWMMGAEELTKEDEMPVGRNVLELSNVMRSANYTCVAISSLGMIEATAQVTVKGECHGQALSGSTAGVPACTAAVGPGQVRSCPLLDALALGSSWLLGVVEELSLIHSLNSNS